MAESNDVVETRKALAKMKASATAAEPPIPPGIGAITPSGDTGLKKAKGGGNTPPRNPSGGFGRWWGGLPSPQKIGALVILGLLVTLLFGEWNLHWEGTRTTAENKNKLETARTEVEIASLAAQAAASRAEEAKSLSRIKTPTKNEALPVVEGNTFSCRNLEELRSGFATSGTIEASQGTQLLLSSGCTWVRFNHEITSLSGTMYTVTFDPVDDPQPVRCGDKPGFANDSPQTCIRFINDRQGQKMRVVINSDGFLKIGG